jgi:hypothetical protein
MACLGTSYSYYKFIDLFGDAGYHGVMSQVEWLEAPDVKCPFHIHAQQR